MPPVLKFDKTWFRYSQQTVLENVSFAVESREFVSVVGPNGGGKTTLLRLAIGLLQPERGVVSLCGDTPKVSRRRVGYTPQHAIIDLRFPVSASDVVLMGTMRPWRLRYSRGDRACAAAMLDRVGLSHIGNKPFGQLSGGERQRVLIARALCCEPEILFLDEPTSHIDPTSEAALFELLHKLNETMTIVLVSHDIGVVTRHVEKVVCVNRRVIVHPTSQLNGQLLRDVYGAELQFIRHDHCDHCECETKPHHDSAIAQHPATS
ncbi:MAG: metal ABC transporter ATP-binding protein [Thermoguttaceae bacterium]